MADSYFNKPVVDLAPGTTYAFKFKWKYSDGTSSAESAILTYTTPGNAPAEAPTKATGLSATSGAFSLLVSWTGDYQNDKRFKGFKAVNIYASSSDLGSSTTNNLADPSKLVGIMSVDAVKNSVTITTENLKGVLGIGNSATLYTTDIYLYYATINESNELYKENNQVTFYRINSTALRVQQANYIDLANGVISIENLTASTGQFLAYLRAGIRNSDGSGARVEISGSSSNQSPPTYIQDGFTRGGGTIYPGITIYNSDGSVGFRANNTGDIQFSGVLRSTTATITNPYTQTHNPYIEIPTNSSQIRFYPQSTSGETNAGKYGFIEVSETNYGGGWDQASITISPPTYKTNGSSSSGYITIWETPAFESYIRVESDWFYMYSKSQNYYTYVSASSSADDGEIVFHPGLFGTGAVYIADNQPINFAALRNIEASTSAPSHNSSASGYKYGDIYFQYTS